MEIKGLLTVDGDVVDFGVPYRCYWRVLSDCIVSERACLTDGNVSSGTMPLTLFASTLSRRFSRTLPFGDSVCSVSRGSFRKSKDVLLAPTST